MVELVVYGIVLGSIIALGAIGLSLVYGIVRFANFAHGEFMTLGAYFALFVVSILLPWIGFPDSRFGPLSFGWRMVIAFPLAMAFVAFIAILFDRILYKKLRAKKAGPLSWLWLLSALHLLQECQFLLSGAPTMFFSGLAL